MSELPPTRDEKIAKTLYTVLAIPLFLLILYITIMLDFDIGKSVMRMQVIFYSVLMLNLFMVNPQKAGIKIKYYSAAEKWHYSQAIRGFILYVFATIFIAVFSELFPVFRLTLWLMIIANVLLILGFIIIALANKPLDRACYILEFEPDQEITSSGIYRFIRHPQYLGMIICLIMFPLSLGSFIAVIPGAAISAYLVGICEKEEATLLENIPAYHQYIQQVKYRFIPGLW